MYKSLLLICLLGVVCAQKNTDVGSTVKSIFDTPPTHAQAQDLINEHCTTHYGKDMRCVRYTLCDINNTVISDGFGIMDIRSYAVPVELEHRGLALLAGILSDDEDKCESYGDRCCNIPDARKPDHPATPRPYKQIRNPDGGCGWRNPDGVGFNTTGDKESQSKFGEFPWMVALYKMKPMKWNPSGKKLDVYVGGGSLIHPAVVLTTAHHVGFNETLKVRAGEWNIKSVEEKFPHQERDVDSIDIHKDFNTRRSNLFYDVALLFLSSPVDTSIPNVGLACLPPPHQPTPGGVRCVASGWGKNKRGNEGRYPKILKKVTVPVVERAQCQTQLRKTRLGHFFELHSSFMCAGGEAGIDTCKGDGGSPLMCPIENEPNRYIQSGMVAWGIGCGEDETPGVYVDISNLRDWIDDKISGKGLDPKVYTF